MIIRRHRGSRIAAAIVLWFFPALSSLAEPPKPPFPVGHLNVYPTIGTAGPYAVMVWSVHLPENADPGFVIAIRQTELRDLVEIESFVEPEGMMLSFLAIQYVGSRFELWAIGGSPPRSYLLDTTVAGLYLPRAEVALRSEDPYPVLPRTRADRPFDVDVTVGGMMDDEGIPDTLKELRLVRHAQPYGATGTGADLDRSLAGIHSEVSLTTNGEQTLAIAINAIPGEDRAKVRGEERFTVRSLPNHEIPELVIASKFIQIWPVADGSINGIGSGEVIGPAVPPIVFQLNDLYPDSRTYAQVYMGGPRSDVTGTILPESEITINDSVPANRERTISDYGGVFDSDGPWTMEILTETPFGTDRIAHVSFTVEGLGMTLDGWRQIHFGSSENSGDGADHNDFDRDGLPNLVEFAFGFDPKQNSAGLLPAPQRSCNQLVIDFTPPAEVKGILYGAEWSITLLPDSWEPVANTGQPPRHIFNVPIDNHPKLYLRLKVSKE